MENKEVLEIKIERARSNIEGCKVAWFLLVSKKNNAKTNKEKESAARELEELNEMEKNYIKEHDALVKEYRSIKEEE